ncbi:MAG TPA: acetoacetate decarboxylase family protein, partial [Rhizomicrobium sp.]
TVLGVRLPAAFDGQRDRVNGHYLAVLWENLTDPIITGREQLGYPKVYASISDARKHHGAYHASAHWLGFSFIDIELTAARALGAADRQAFFERSQFGDGLILHKYLPKTGAPWTEAEADYFTFAPLLSDRNREKKPPFSSIRTGKGKIQFRRPRWQDMPTQHHIVNALADLPVHEWREASIIEAVDYTDYNDQRILL